MPAINDLTPEEEAEFAQHGVVPAGPGGEPITELEAEPPEPPEGQEPPEPPAGQEPAEPPAEPKPGELGSRHRADGTFKSADELAADKATLEAQPPAEPPQSRMVPHEALHAERQRSAQAIRTAQLATARLNAILTAREQRVPGNEVPMPDINQDPAGYILALEQRLVDFQNERAQEHQFRQIDNALEQDEQLFAQSVPDYDDASTYFVNSRAQELLQFYPPDQAKNIMTEEARQIANQAWQRGMSAGQVIYQLATARGYRPNMNQQPAPLPVPQPNGGGVQPQAAVRAVRAGQQASRSLSGSGGVSLSTQELNAEALLAMSDDEFEQYLGLGQKGANSRFAAIG